MKDVDYYMNRFMLLMVVSGIAGFVLFGVGIAPLIATCLVGGTLLIVTVVWMLEFRKEERRAR